MKKLFLHVGLHKTGTTAIQNFANKNSELLKRHNLIYPDFLPYIKKTPGVHHELAHSLAGQGNDRIITEKQLFTLVEKWIKKSQHFNADFLVSSEAISRHVDNSISGSWLYRREKYLQKLADLFFAFDVVIIIVLRRQDNFVESLYKESVAKNANSNCRDFSDYRNSFLKKSALNDYDSLISLYQKYFTNLIVLVYEDLIEGPGLYVNFFKNVGIGLDIYSDNKRIRVSLSPIELKLKSLMNAAVSTKEQNERVMKWIHSEDVQNILNKHYGNKKFDLWESLEARINFLQQYHNINEKIRSKYFPAKDTLFPLSFNEMFLKSPELSNECIAELLIQQLNIMPVKNKTHN